MEENELIFPMEEVIPDEFEDVGYCDYIWKFQKKFNLAHRKLLFGDNSLVRYKVNMVQPPWCWSNHRVRKEWKISLVEAAVSSAWHKICLIKFFLMLEISQMSYRSQSVEIGIQSTMISRAEGRLLVDPAWSGMDSGNLKGCKLVARMFQDMQMCM